MNIILMGMPASGKGTQSKYLIEHLKIPHISTGDILRSNVNEKTPLGIKAKAYMDKGSLVPDELMVDLIKQRITQPDCRDGYILDGFPRTIPQAKALDEVTSIDKVISIEVPDEVAFKRIAGRYTHEPSGRSYNIYFTPRPKKMDLDPEGNVVAAYDDQTGEQLVQRKDDTPAAVEVRLKSYHELTEPIKAYYRQKGPHLLVEIDGTKTPEEVFASIKAVLS
ncbi:MAG: adenylate kinase [DPANN group archaeon]|nr:adenylate kinase [DPANN group archaeon]